MRRVKVILAALAMLVLSVVNAAPAMANHDWDGWWDNCNWVIVGWHWIPAWWGWDWTWVLVCEPSNDWSWDDNHGDWDDDDDDSK